MTNRDMALGHLRQAEIRLQTARFAREHGHWPFAVRQAQECVELALKAALNVVGLDPPKWHDVGVVLQRERRRFPEWFAKDVDLMAHRSRTLMDDRERSMYGSAEMSLPAHEIFGELDGREAVTAADETFAAVKRLVEAQGA